ncbi:MAG: tetratricopeptide repeat protein, partial [Bryobacteraceae bacterium]
MKYSVVLLAAVCLAAQTGLIETARQAQQAGDYARAVRVYRELLKRDPERADLLSNLGVALYMEGKDDRAALDALQRSLKLSPSAVPPNLFAGLCLTRMRQPAEALPYLQRAYSGDRSGPLTTLALARAHVALREFRAANRFYHEAAQRDERLAEAWFGLGITYRSLLQDLTSHGGPFDNGSSVKASRSAFETDLKTLDANPEDGAARKRAVVAGRQLALAALLKAVQLEPESAQAHLLLAHSHRESGNLVEAVREYEAAIRIRPNLAGAHLGLATAHWKTGNIESVSAPLEQALALAPDDPEANGILADLRVRAGDFDGAREAGEKALRGNANLPHVRAVLAKAYLAQDEPGLALRELERILALDETGSYYY